MSVKIQFFGYAGYKIITKSGVHIVVDPFLNDNPVAPFKADELDRVDLLLITHNAYDHFGDAPEILRKYKCPVICAKDVVHNLTTVHGIDPDLMRVTIWGMLMEVAGVTVRSIESHHWSFTVTPDQELLSGPAMGFMIDAALGVRIYHPGDTALTYDMKMWGELYKPNVGLMHISLPENSLPHMECYKCGEITPYEGWLASQWLGLEHIIDSHYIDPGCDDVKQFCELVEKSVEAGAYQPKLSVIKPGEMIELD
ncbi:MAG: MBL fold metallo-hydrolase [Anaerolineaceae bacterium]|nr:MBL fold metallo-hydrolase [Anaerolineaceae bacterium]